MKSQLISLLVSLILSWLGATLILSQDVAGDQLATLPRFMQHLMQPQPGGIINSGTITNSNNMHKVKLGNTKTLNVNKNYQNNQPHVQDSVYTSSTSGHDAPLTAPTHYANGRIGQPQPTGPTHLQNILKEKMLELLDKATSDNSAKANNNKKKLEELLKMIDSSILPERWVETLLKDAADGQIDDELPPPDEAPAQEEPPAEPPTEEQEPPAPDFEMEQEPPIPEEVKEEVRGFMADRLNRITDLLYFRPEFMNVMMKLDRCNELAPLEADFVRLVMCNSDPTLCNQPACPQPEEPPADGEAPPDDTSSADAPVDDPPVDNPPGDEPIVQSSGWSYGIPHMHHFMPEMPEIPPMPAMQPMPKMQMPQFIHPNHIFGQAPGGVPMVQSSRGPVQQQSQALPNRVRSGHQATAPQQLKLNPNFKPTGR